jgi:ribosomal protein S26
LQTITKSLYSRQSKQAISNKEITLKSKKETATKLKKWTIPKIEKSLKAIIDSAQYSEVTRTRNKEKKRKKILEERLFA